MAGAETRLLYSNLLPNGPHRNLPNSICRWTVGYWSGQPITHVCSPPESGSMGDVHLEQTRKRIVLIEFCGFPGVFVSCGIAVHMKFRRGTKNRSTDIQNNGNRVDTCHHNRGDKCEMDFFDKVTYLHLKRWTFVDPGQLKIIFNVMHVKQATACHLFRYSFFYWKQKLITSNYQRLHTSY